MNMKLSKLRAQAVRNYLINKGIHPDRLESEGYGPDKPKVSGTDEAARAKNRRVEFIILD
jgi:OOP family OmpA-OmpF porin